MNYKGLVIWIKSKKDIFQFHEKGIGSAFIDNTPAVAQILDNEIHFQFNWDNLGYSITFKKITDNIFQGKIINNHEAWGEAILHVFAYGQKYLCRMEWNEEANPYDCFVSLEPAK